MRNLLILLVINVFLLSMGCSANDEAVYLTPVTEATFSAYGKIGAPIKTKLDAVIVARIWMQANRKHSIGDPQVVYAEKISIAEASQKIGWDPTAGDKHLKNIKVWLVIFEGEWQLHPFPSSPDVMPTLAPPSHACQFFLFAADDGGAIAGGDVTCPSETK